MYFWLKAGVNFNPRVPWGLPPPTPNLTTCVNSQTRKIRTIKQMFKTENESYKNDRESKRLRELGNEAFKKLRDRKALELYTEAVVFADQVSYLWWCFCANGNLYDTKSK